MSESNTFYQIRLIVKKIPLGKVATYGQIAALAGLRSARVVGWAMRDTKDKDVPCHRVIKSDGSLSENFGQGGQYEQKALLSSEGVDFVKDFKVDLKKYQYCFPK